MFICAVRGGMEMLFDDSGNLRSTDYWQSEDCRAGRPCCAVRNGIWHLLVPLAQPMPRQAPRALALPVLSATDPERWRWKLWLTPDWPIALPLGCFCGPAPALPQPGAEMDRMLRIYGFWLPGLDEVTYNFGHFENGGPQCVYRAPLRVARVRLPRSRR